MYSVVAAKKMVEKLWGHELGAEQTALKWQEHVKMASCAEVMKTSYVDACLTVWRRCMSDPECALLITWQDSQAQAIFDSLYKLDAIVKRANSVTHICYSLGYIIDMVYNQGASAGEFAVRQLSGKGLPGGKGKIDMILAKRELALGFKEFCVDRKFSEAFVKKIVTWSDGIHYYRRDMQNGTSP